MVEHKVKISPAQLRDMASLKPNPEEVKLLAKVWAWTDGLVLEDSSAAFTFAQLGIEPDVVGAIVGETVWTMLFHGEAVHHDAYIPYQVRQILAYQMRTLVGKITSSEMAQVRTDATQSLENHLGAIRKTVKSITKEKKRRAKAQPRTSDEESDMEDVI